MSERTRHRRAKGLYLLLGLALTDPAFALDGQQGRMAASDDEVRRAVVSESVAAYLATGRPCPCPYSVRRNMQRCTFVAWKLPGGFTPRCFPDDVLPEEIEAWRAHSYEPERRPPPRRRGIKAQTAG